LKFILAALVLASLALAGSRRVLFARRVPLGARLIFLTGTEFLVVGMLLGERFIGLIDSEALAGLSPFAAVGLGWLGLLFGLQFDYRALKTLPGSYFSASIFQSLFTLFAVFALFFVLLGHHVGRFDSHVFLAAAALGAGASCTGQPALAMIQRNFQFQDRRILSLLRYIASLDPLPAVLLFGIASCVLGGAGEMAIPLGGAGRLVFGIGIAALIGWMLVSLGWGRTSQPELLLAVLGTCAICGGVAMQLRISVLFLSVICGVIVANSSRIRFRMTEYLAGGEKFIYILLLILAGASLNVTSAWAVLLGLVFFGSRLIAKVAGTYLATLGLRRTLDVPPRIGLGLTAQAGMAMAIAVDFQQTIKSVHGDAVLTIAVIGIIVSELVGPAAAMTVLRGPRESAKEAS